MSNGYMWKKQRKFAQTHLRYFGEGQKSLENYIQVESNFMCEAFKDEQGKQAVDVRLQHVKNISQLNGCLFFSLSLFPSLPLSQQESHLTPSTP